MGFEVSGTGLRTDPKKIDPGTGEQYAVNQENGQVKPTHMEELKGVIPGTTEVTQFCKIKFKNPSEDSTDFERGKP